MRFATLAVVDRRSPRGVKVAAGVLLAGLALDAAHLIFGLDVLLGGWRGTVLYNGLLVGGGLLATARGFADPGERWVWWLLGGGGLLWASGNLYWQFFLEAETVPPFPSVSDGLWLAFYLPVVAGLCILTRRRVRGVPGRLWLDGLICGLAVAAASSTIVFDAVVNNLGGNPTAVAVNLAYPTADLVLLVFMAVVLGAARQGFDRSWLFLAAAIATFVIGDSVYLVEVAQGTYALDTILDIGWPLAIVLLGLAAWQTPRPVDHPHTGDEASIVVPVLLACLVLGLLVFDHFRQTQALSVILAAGSLLAALGRLVVTNRSNHSLLDIAGRAAMTDPLTGLGNRRPLMEAIQRVLDGRDPRPMLLALFDLNGFKNYNDSFGHPAGDSLLIRLAGRLAQSMPPGGEAFRMGGDEFCALLPCELEDDPAQTLLRARSALHEQGEGFSISTACGYVMLRLEADTASHALAIADHRLYEDKTSGRVSAGRQSSDVLLRLVDECDHPLAGHAGEVAELVARTATTLGFDGIALEQVVLAAELHDIGKTAIPNEILQKGGPPTDAEWEFIRRHTVIGERILSAAPSLAPIAHIVRSSHERFDGAGYPDGLAGDGIPLASRIVFVCDAFEAMTAQRPYNVPMTPVEARRELRRCSGSQFDPVVVDAFCKACPAPGSAGEAEVAVSAL